MSSYRLLQAMGRIVISAPGQERGSFELSKDLITIGRAATNDVVLPDSRVSRAHASIRCSEAGITLIPSEHCTNGVFVNGELIAGEHRLAHRDVIHMGECELVYEDSEAETQAVLERIKTAEASGLQPHEHTHSHGHPQHHSAAPTKIAEYQVKEKVGDSFRSVIYKALDPLGRDVAVKVLTDNNPGLVECLKKEATILARMNHPNIMKVFRFGTAGETPFLAMEFLRGQPLSQFMRMKTGLHLCERLEIVIRATEGMRYMHDENFIHRDIKPRNLMILDDLDVRLIGFGFAEISASGEGEVAGTPSYMSPMHFEGKRGDWCDVFSMGVVLFELLTRSLPFALEDDDLTTAYHMLMSVDPAPLLSSMPGVEMVDLYKAASPDSVGYPPELETLVAKVLSKRMGDGYSIAADFQEALLKLQDTLKPEFIGHLLRLIDHAASAHEYSECENLLARIRRLDCNCAARKQVEIGRTDHDFQKFVHERGDRQPGSECVPKPAQ